MSDASDVQRFVDVAQEAALAAGEIQMRSIGEVKEISFKGRINLVTDVDRMCEEKITQIIQRSFPDHGWLAEEEGEKVSPSSFQWIIDPLDGTTNYAHGYPRFCVSIALMKDHSLLCGAVYDPWLQEMFLGVKGKGAWLNQQRIQVTPETELGNSLLATGFAYDVREGPVIDNLDHFADFIVKGRAVRRDGSASLNLCYVAVGRFDGFWEMKLHPWDTAAGALIIEEAGGKVSDFSGNPFDLFGEEILATNRHIHQQMVEVLQHGAIGERGRDNVT